MTDLQAQQRAERLVSQCYKTYTHAEAVALIAAELLAVQREKLSRLEASERLLNGVKDEIAALFPHPRDPSLHDAQAVCAANNPADAACLLKAMELLNEWREL